MIYIYVYILSMRKNHLSSTKLVKEKQITIHELSKSITFLNFKKSLVKAPTCELQYDRLSTKKKTPLSLPPPPPRPKYGIHSKNAALLGTLTNLKKYILM